MASPQVENGHTRIANELLDQLARLHLSPNQWQILFFIIRKTYGFHKKADYITNAQIVEGTGIHKAHVSRAMSNLIGRQVLIRQGKLTGIQKDYEAWQKLPELVTKVTQTGNNLDPEKLPELVTGVTRTGNKKLPELVTKVTSTVVTQKIKDNKDTIQKKEYGEFHNVLLTDEEYQKLKDKFGNRAQALIENLSSYMASKKTKYISHYATILNWARKDKEEHGAHRNSRELPKTYTPSPDDYPELQSAT